MKGFSVVVKIWKASILPEAQEHTLSPSCVSLELYFPSCPLHTFSCALWDLRQDGPQALPSVRGLLCFCPVFLGSE